MPDMSDETSKFSVSTHLRGSAVVLDLHGKADLLHLDELHRALDSARPEGEGNVVIDLTDLEFINSMGLGELIHFRNRLREKGSELRLAGANGMIAEMLDKTRLDEVMPLYETVGEAVAG